MKNAPFLTLRTPRFSGCFWSLWLGLLSHFVTKQVDLWHRLNRRSRNGLTCPADWSPPLSRVLRFLDPFNELLSLPVRTPVLSILATYVLAQVFAQHPPRMVVDLLC